MTQTLARALSLGLVFVFCVPANAEAKKYKSRAMRSDSVIVALLKKQSAELEAIRKKQAADAIAMQKELAEFKKLFAAKQQIVSIDPDELKSESPRNPIAVAPMPVPDPTKTLKGYERHIARSAKLKDLTPPLAAKVARVLAQCPGARLTSGYRRGARVAGSGRPSLHSHYPSRAADLAGNPSCIRRQFAKWPGGLSIDYAAVHHYHVSYAPGGREWGARFAHYRGSRGSHRVARYDRHSAPRYARSTVQTVASAHAPQ